MKTMRSLWEEKGKYNFKEKRPGSIDVSTWHLFTRI